MKKLTILRCIPFMLIIPLLQTQALPSDVTPEMIEQLKSMSPSQQKALADQFGIGQSVNEEEEKPSNLDALSNDRFEELSDIENERGDEGLEDFFKELERLTEEDDDRLQEFIKELEGFIEEEESINQSEDFISKFEDYLEVKKNDESQYFTEEELDIIKAESEVSLNSRFGLSIFQKKVSTFSPMDNLPVPDDYKLGAGDQLIIKLLGTENMQLSQTISRDGTIFLNQIGEIVLSGLLFDEAVVYIKQRIESELIGVQAFVTMGRIKSINVIISGEVLKPGTYALSALTSVSQSLYQAGGITDIGSLRNIQVLRKGRLIHEFDSYDLLIQGNTINDIRLRSGDILFVPTYAGTVSISGNVKRSGLFESKKSDKIRDLLKWAGGYSSNANPKFGVLTSADKIGTLPKLKTLNLNNSESLNLDLKPNDRLYIPPIGKDPFHAIRVTGAVNRPGNVGWFEGMRLSDVINDSYEDLIFDSADVNFGFVERIDPITFVREILSFNPQDVIAQKSIQSNLPLQDKDVVHILYKDDRRNKQIESALVKLRNQSSNKELTKIITLSGAVKFPGDYPIFKDGTLDTIFAAAGGFNDDALIGSIEVSRTKLIEDGSVESNVVEISALDELNESTSFKIQSRDRIHVRQVQELNTSDTVTLSGEVRYPGVYPINKDDTLLSILERAGGLVDGAFSQGAYLQRLTTMEAQKKSKAELASKIRSSFAASLLTSEEVSISFDEINSVAEILENTQNDGRVVIRLDAALGGNKDYNIKLEEGDTLFVPKEINTVSVIGEVNGSNSLIYDSNLDVEDYIALAGGFAPRANSKDIYIIQANGSITPIRNLAIGFGLSRYKLQQGDTIVVPVKATYRDRLGLWTTATQLFYQSVVSLAALDNFSN